MKRLVQIFLFGLLIIICIYFYKYSLRQETKNNNDEEESLIVNTKTDQNNKNNFIENLSYGVNLDGNRKYMITAQESEISNLDGSEIISMNFVIAEYIDEEKKLLTIKSKNATYNTSNFNSRFKNNVKITYLNHLIEAENVYIDFKNNFILIKDNVVYDGPLASIASDGIKIDLVTKNISIFMDKKLDDINLKSKK
jgi:hypothetical protein